MIRREENGIKTVRNGEHRILQMQLDLHGESLRRIENRLDALIKADERSKLNFKLICLLIAAVLGSYGVIIIV